MCKLLSEIMCDLCKLHYLKSLCQSLDKMQCFLSQNASVLCEGIECENAVNLSMNCNSIDLNSCKISDKMLSNHNTINTLNTYHYFHCFWPKCHYKTRHRGHLATHKLIHKISPHNLTFVIALWQSLVKTYNNQNNY